MQKAIIFFSVVCLTACSSPGSSIKWEEAEKKQFKQDCNVTFKESMGADRTDKYCGCLMEKLQEKGIKFENSNQIPSEIIQEAAEDCGLD